MCNCLVAQNFFESFFEFFCRGKNSLAQHPKAELPTGWSSGNLLEKFVGYGEAMTSLILSGGRSHGLDNGTGKAFSPPYRFAMA